jgi:HEAT repeat protein
MYPVYDLISAIRDPARVPVLITFSHSQSDRLRESVIHALREIGNRTAEPVLVEALDDRVASIRYDAVLGLATVEGRWDLAPSVDTFAANEPKYVGAWKSWWLGIGKNQTSDKH